MLFTDSSLPAADVQSASTSGGRFLSRLKNVTTCHIFSSGIFPSHAAIPE